MKLTNVVKVWHLMAITLLVGIVNAFDVPSVEDQSNFLDEELAALRLLLVTRFCRTSQKVRVVLHTAGGKH